MQEIVVIFVYTSQTTENEGLFILKMIMANYMWKCMIIVTCKLAIEKKKSFKSLLFFCFTVEQKFHGHLLATRIFHLATEKNFSHQLGAPGDKKVNFRPCKLFKT